MPHWFIQNVKNDFCELQLLGSDVQDSYILKWLASSPTSNCMLMLMLTKQHHQRDNRKLLASLDTWQSFVLFPITLITLMKLIFFSFFSSFSSKLDLGSVWLFQHFPCSFWFAWKKKESIHVIICVRPAGHLVWQKL